MRFRTALFFALTFLGTTTIPLIAVVGIKWAILTGDRQQKIGVPIIVLALLAFAYWLSIGVTIQAFDYNVSGLALLIISAGLGLISAPAALAGPG